MATKKEIDTHLKIALDEIGKIKPWFDKEVNEWIFSHPLYPVEYGGESAKEVVDNYPKYLREFIKHRLNNKLESLIEKKTKGRGGMRPGAGRPKGTKKTETKTIRLGRDLAIWVKNHENDLEAVRSGEKIIVPVNQKHENHFMGTGT